MALSSIHKHDEKFSSAPLIVRPDVYRELPLFNRAVLQMMVERGEAVILPADDDPSC